MGTTAQKLEYLGTTKSQLKDMINYGLPTENQITNETTFRNYVKSIFEAFLESLRDSTTLYTNLPKISGNGTQITLNDTANAPMRITLNPTALSQDATPTPDSPQDIHTISGDNSVVIEGKNLFDINSKTAAAQFRSTTTLTNGVWSITSTGASGYALLSPNTAFKPNTTYTVSFDYTGDLRQCAMFSSGSTIFGSTSNTNVLTFTTTSETYNLRLGVYPTTNNSITVTNIQIEKGNQPTTYEPYVSQTNPINLDTIEYCKIGNYEDEFIRTSGKNLFDKDGTNFDNHTGINNFNGKQIASNTFVGSSCYNLVSNNARCQLYFKGTIGQTYYLSYKSGYELTAIKAFGSDGIITETLTTQNQINMTNEYIGISMKKSDGTDFTDAQILELKNSIMINLGTTALPYEPYGTNQWYLKKNIGKVVLDGSEAGWNVIAFSNTNDFKEAYTTAFDNDILWNTRNGFVDRFSNYNDVIIPTSNITSECFSLGSDKINSTGRVRFAISSNTISTTAQWKTWLSNNNTTVYYVLNTPTYTQITGTLETQLENIYSKMLSYNGTTNVSQQNNDLPFVLSCTALEDLSTL